MRSNRSIQARMQILSLDGLSFNEKLILCSLDATHIQDLSTLFFLYNQARDLAELLEDGGKDAARDLRDAAKYDKRAVDLAKSLKQCYKVSSNDLPQYDASHTKRNDNDEKSVCHSLVQDDVCGCEQKTSYLPESKSAAPDSDSDSNAEKNDLHKKLGINTDIDEIKDERLIQTPRNKITTKHVYNFTSIFFGHIRQMVNNTNRVVGIYTSSTFLPPQYGVVGIVANGINVAIDAGIIANSLKNSSEVESELDFTTRLSNILSKGSRPFRLTDSVVSLGFNIASYTIRDNPMVSTFLGLGSSLFAFTLASIEVCVDISHYKSLMDKITTKLTGIGDRLEIISEEVKQIDKQVGELDKNDTNIGSNEKSSLLDRRKTLFQESRELIKEGKSWEKIGESLDSKHTEAYQKHRNSLVLNGLISVGSAVFTLLAATAAAITLLVVGIVMLLRKLYHVFSGGKKATPQQPTPQQQVTTQDKSTQTSPRSDKLTQLMSGQLAPSSTEDKHQEQKQTNASAQSAVVALPVGPYAVTNHSVNSAGMFKRNIESKLAPALSVPARRKSI